MGCTGLAVDVNVGVAVAAAEAVAVGTTVSIGTGVKVGSGVLVGDIFAVGLGSEALHPAESVRARTKATRRASLSVIRELPAPVALDIVIFPCNLPQPWMRG